MLCRPTRARLLQIAAPLLLFAFTQLSFGQPLLRMQISNAEMQMEVNRQLVGNSAKGQEFSTVNRDVTRYPNTGSCVSVYENGNFIFEKKDERTLGHPKVKSVEGVLTPEEMARLKAILENEDLKKVTTPPAPNLPSDTSAIREMERLDAQVNRAGAIQRFTTLKERVKTSGQGAVSDAPSNGADTYLDNSAGIKKTLSPLVKWFEEFGKKNKSRLKDSTKDYCEE